MKKIYTLLALFFSGITVTHSQLLFDDNFDYGSSTGTLTTLTSNWVKHSGTNIDLAYATTSLCMPSYANSGVGGSINVSPSMGEDANRAFTPQTSGNVYASALINISSASNTENYFMHFMKGTSIFYSKVYAKDDGSGNLKIGIQETGGGTPGAITYSTANYSYSTTYLLVIKYDFTNGSSSLFVLNSVVGSEPTADAVSSDGSNATDFESLAFRQSGNIPSAQIDGVRVGNTWSDLMSAPSTPTVNFASASITKGEASGTSTVTINISPAPAGAETFDVTIANTSTTYTNDYTTNPVGTSTFTLNVAASATSVSFDVTVVDDSDQESSESFTATISNPSSGLTVGCTDVLTFTITDNDSPITLTPIKDIQATTGGDASDMVGQTVNLGGRVSAIASNGFYIQDNAGAWNGIFVYDGGSNTVARGDSVLVTGDVAEFAPGSSTEKSTQITNVTSFSNEGAYTAYTAVLLTTSAVNAEMYESVLVHVVDAITKTTPDSFGEWTVNDKSGNVVVDDFLYTVTPTPVVNDIYEIYGVVGHNFGNFKIMPRDASDVTKTGTHLAINDNNKSNISIYPNPSKGLINISHIGQIEVKVYDAQGKIVKNTNSKTFNLESGIYTIVITTDEGVSSERLIVE